MRIGLALSGGGMRAAVYHLGVLKYLAEKKLLGNVKHISTVSGASICMGLIYACNANQWPKDTQLLKQVLPEVKNVLRKRISSGMRYYDCFYNPITGIKR